MGGVGLFLRSDIVSLPRSDISIFLEGVFESVFVEVIAEGRRFIVGSIYRPPNSNTAEFLQLLSATFTKIKDKKSYVMGDFNFDLLKYHENASSAEFLDEITSAGFQPLISLPSRITHNTTSLIDNIFTNDFCKPMTSGLITTPISDHLATFAIFSESKHHHNKGPRYITKREMSQNNKLKFKEWVKEWGNNVTFGMNSIKKDAVTFIDQL